MNLDKLIGSGNAAEVFQVSENQVLKLFFKDYPLSKIEREYHTARLAYEAGIPTAEVFGDILEVDGRKGILFEYIRGSVLNKAFSEAMHTGDTAAAEMYLRKHCDIMKQCHSVTMDKTQFSPAREEYDQKLAEAISHDMLSEQEAEKIKEFLDTIPDSSGFIHGDFNIANVIITNKGIRLIDMGACKYGNPIYDIVSNGTAFVEMRDAMPVPNVDKLAKQRTGMAYQDVIFFWDRLKAIYYENLPENEMAAVQKKIHSLAAVNILLGLLSGGSLPKEAAAMFKARFLPEIAE